METLEHILLVLHLLGYGALFGGLVVQARSPEKSVNAAMRDGIGTAFVAGLALVGVLESGDDFDRPYPWLGVKLVIALVILVLVMVNVRKERIPQGLWALLLLLTVTNVCVAVLW